MEALGIDEFPAFERPSGPHVKRQTASRLPGALGEYPRAHELMGDVVRFAKETWLMVDKQPKVLDWKSIHRIRGGGLTLADPKNITKLTGGGERGIVRDLGGILLYLVCGTESRDLNLFSANFKDLVKKMTAMSTKFSIEDVEDHIWMKEKLSDQGKAPGHKGTAHY